MGLGKEVSELRALASISKKLSPNGGRYSEEKSLDDILLGMLENIKKNEDSYPAVDETENIRKEYYALKKKFNDKISFAAQKLRGADSYIDAFLDKNSYFSIVFDLFFFYKYPHLKKLEESIKIRGYNPYKGIWLQGGMGTGKTSIMSFCTTNILGSNIYSPFQIKEFFSDASPKEIFDGRPLINPLYVRKDITIDDIGAEDEADLIHYSKSKILNFRVNFERHKMYFDSGFKIKTHYTSNFSIEDLQKKYSKYNNLGYERLNDRVSEMCNIIIVPEGTKSFRKS